MCQSVIRKRVKTDSQTIKENLTWLNHAGDRAIGSSGDLSRTLFVSGLGLDVTEESLTSYLEQFGKLKSLLIVKNKATGKPKGYRRHHALQP